jgi:hypothetical protein
VGSERLRKSPALTEHVKAMIAASPDSLRRKRDQALILLGFAGAFRRSELVVLDEDVEEVELGLRVLYAARRPTKKERDRWLQSCAVLPPAL